jgi:hypothetical protein
MKLWILYFVLLILVPGAMFFVGVAYGVGPELTAALTAVYAGLVLLQVWEMREARQQQVRDRQEDEKRRYCERPILRLGPFKAEPPLFRVADELGQGGQPLGFAFYVNLPLTNVGRTLARRCQPLLTAVAQLEDGNWKRDANWVPIPLRWILDEPNLRTQGRFTEERDLVPNRPYLFDLCRISDRSSVLMLLPVIRPTGQNLDLFGGEYCFEVTAFSENAEPVVGWYGAKWNGHAVPNRTLTAGWEALSIVELTAPPWG